MKSVVCLSSILISLTSWAQAPLTYTVKAGVAVEAVIPQKEIYRYPSFINGVVVFKDGVVAPGKLNYSMLIAAIQFIDPKGDTLALANEETISHVVINTDTFFYNEGYVRVITGSATIKLGERVGFREYVQKQGAYGLSSSTTATDNVTSILNLRSIDLNSSPEVVLVKNTSYCIGNKFNEFSPVDKKSILKIFPRQKKKIEEYLETNAVNFNKQEDLIRLIDYIKGL